MNNNGKEGYVNTKDPIFWVILLFILIIGIFIGEIISDNKDLGAKEIRENSKEFSFTNPLLECELGNKYISKQEVKPKKSKILDLIEKEIRFGNVNFVSVYFRDLNNGPWLGINEKEKFYPASLMKVPLMMYYYKKAENQPEILDKKIEPNLPKNLFFREYFPSIKTVDLNKSYKISELIESSIKYSDNYATRELNSLLDQKDISNMIGNLGIDIKISDDHKDYINVKDYATFFRVLFNSSFLNRYYSEKALQLLSNTTFDSGIKKYLPKEIVVAHKFGEKEADLFNLLQIHDCGIVYYPSKPYLICIMTRGQDPQKTTEVISKISKMIFDDIKSN